MINYVPWEDEEEAKQQLAEYVKNNPNAEFIFDAKTSRPDTTYLLNKEIRVAEISTKLIAEAAEAGKEIGEGVSYRSVLEYTHFYHPESSTNTPSGNDEPITILEKIKYYIDNNRTFMTIVIAIIIFVSILSLTFIYMSKVFK